MIYNELPPLNPADKQFVDELVYNYIACLCLQVYIDCASNAIVDRMMLNYENNLNVERDQEMLNNLQLSFEENQENLSQIKLLFKTSKFRY